VKTSRHPQHRKYVTYRNAVTGRTKPRPQSTCTKSGEVQPRDSESEIYELTDKHTSHHNTAPPPGGEVIIPTRGFMPFVFRLRQNKVAPKVNKKA